MAATWKWWQTLHEFTGVGTEGQISSSITQSIAEGSSLQRILISGGISITSTDSGSAIGNPIFAPYYWRLRLSLQPGTEPEEIYLERQTVTGSMGGSTDNGVSVTRRTAWSVPASFWEHSVQARSLSQGAWVVTCQVQAQPTTTSGPNTIWGDAAEGELLMRVLTSTPG